MAWLFEWQKLYEPVTGKPVFIQIIFKQDGTIVRTQAFNVNGTAYTGDITLLLPCP